MAPRSTPGLTALTRRALLRAGMWGGASLALGASVARARTRATTQPGLAAVTRTYDFNQGWRFGGVYKAGSESPSFSDASFERIVLPHTVTRLSWGDWKPADWERLWIYRKRFSVPVPSEARVFVDFDGVMTNATVYLNGVQLAEHLGGYLPFSVELTDGVVAGENDLGVVVDGRLLDVPPSGNVTGVASIDYLQPAGINRDATLRVVPQAYVSDVFAKPVDVLSAEPSLQLTVTVDSSGRIPDRVMLTAELLDESGTLATHTARVRIADGTTTVTIDLRHLQGIKLWSPSSPTLYTVRVTLSGTDIARHTLEVNTGFREATFTTSGFYLNGERLQIFGLNRHGLYPYTGMAAPRRLQARDAQFIKQELNCNMVRCSHYPQSPHFLDECDRLGLMVWEEPPGWMYIGDENFTGIFLQNVHDMVVRDRSRPSVVVWGTRLDETSSYPTLYAEARELAYALDGSRQTTGAMDTHLTTGWAEDVFSYDDYDSSGGNAELQPPIPGIPYLVSETVGALEGEPLFRWIDPSTTLAAQARLHAEVNEIARGDPAYSGVLAWCAIDYASLLAGDAVWQNLKWPGVMDTFRVPKPGAAFYRSQLSPSSTPVIIPAFFWDFGPQSPATGPGPNTVLATNCQSLEVYVAGQLVTTAVPDVTNFGNLPYPPALVDLTVDGSTLPDLTVLGYVAGVQVTALNMSADTTTDRLGLTLEDDEIVGDGSDATRLVFRAFDAYGNQRPYVAGGVTLSLKGTAAEIVGQNPFAFATYGGVGSVFLRSRAGRHGTVHVTASHPTLGTRTVTLKVVGQTALMA